jgi:50S ribosomal subunit-associated GTPase HflX
MAEKPSKSGKLEYTIDPHGPSMGRAAQWHWYVYEAGRPGVLATGMAKGARRNAELEAQAAIHRLERERERKKSKRKAQRRGRKAS